MKVKFIDPVQHDAEHFAPGDSANLPDDAAKKLIELGAAELVDAKAAKAAAAVNKTD